MKLDAFWSQDDVLMPLSKRLKEVAGNHEDVAGVQRNRSGLANRSIIHCITSRVELVDQSIPLLHSLNALRAFVKSIRSGDAEAHWRSCSLGIGLHQTGNHTLVTCVRLRDLDIAASLIILFQSLSSSLP